MPDTERRRFTRISLDASTEIKHGEQAWQAMLVDISFNGMLLHCDSPLEIPIGDSVDITVHLLGNDVTIKTPATLAHIRDNDYGFLIENLDLDALTHLRRLVELNLGDEALLDRELDHFFEQN